MHRWWSRWGLDKKDATDANHQLNAHYLVVFVDHVFLSNRVILTGDTLSTAHHTRQPITIVEKMI